MHEEITISTRGQGLYEFTRELGAVVKARAVDDGLCCAFVRHTSAGITIQENADPSAKNDLESWIRRHVPEDDPEYTHTMEGPDDMPAHIKAVLTGSSVTIPIVSGSLALGTWQGVYLWEFRSSPHTRRILVTVMRGDGA